MGPNRRKISERNEKVVVCAAGMDLVLPAVSVFLGSSVESVEYHSRQNLVQCTETLDIWMCASIYMFNAEHIPVKLLLDTNRIRFTAESCKVKLQEGIHKSHLVSVVN